MAALALTDVTVTLNATDISDYVKSVTLDLNANTLDSTTMGDSWTEMIGGVKSGSVSIELVDDFADSAIDDILFPLFGTVVTFAARPTSAVVGSSNPSYSGSVLVNQLTAFGSHGELATKSLTWPTSGTIARAESA